MQARLQPTLREIVVTVREQTDANHGHKRALAEMTPKDGDHLDLHTRQSNFIDMMGLGERPHPRRCGRRDTLRPCFKTRTHYVWGRAPWGPWLPMQPPIRRAARLKPREAPWGQL